MISSDFFLHVKNLTLLLLQFRQLFSNFVFMEMEEDTEDFVDGITYASDAEFEIDSDYEFDAATFFDFTRQETESQTKKALKWFDYADTYPSSPFIVKLNLEKIFASKQHCSSSKSEDVGNINSISSSNSVKTKKTKTLRSSTLMKPTLSLLAKQDKLQDLHLRHLIHRPRQLLAKLDERSLQSPPGNLATKRQKLENGFLRKIAQLNHQPLLIHKTVKKDGSLGSSLQRSKLKVTIPKEPQLETMQRAQRHRSNITSGSESSEEAKLKVHKFNSRRLNGKIHGALSPKRSTHRLPENQVPDSDQNGIIHAKSSNLEDGLKKEKCEVLLNSDICDLRKKESSISSDESLSHKLPIESFSKLSINLANESNSKSQAKLNKYTMGLKENSAGSFELDFWRCAGKPNQCGSDNMILETGHHNNVSRSLDIHCNHYRASFQLQYS